MSKIDGQNAFAIGVAAKGIISTGVQPLDHTVTFLVDGKPYEKSLVKNGNSVNAPATEPTSASGSFKSWGQVLPFVPSEDVELNAEFVKSQVDRLYKHYVNINKEEYPFLTISLYKDTVHGCVPMIEFSHTALNTNTNTSCKYIRCNKPIDISDLSDETVVNFVIENTAMEVDLSNNVTDSFSSGEQWLYLVNYDTSFAPEYNIRKML